MYIFHQFISYFLYIYYKYIVFRLLICYNDVSHYNNTKETRGNYMSNTILDFNSPSPLYLQLYDILHQKIMSGELPPGSKMPTESQLIEQYSVSRITVRKAMDLLTEENLIIKRSGKGSFVMPTKIQEHINGQNSFTITCQMNNLSAETTLITQELRPATEAIAKLLKIPDNSYIIYVKRLRFADKVPIMLERIYLRFDLFEYILHADLSKNSLYTLIDQKYPENQRKLSRTVELSTATSEQGKYLNLPKGAPTLYCQELVTDLSHTPLFRITQNIAGERIRFTSQT